MTPEEAYYKCIYEDKRILKLEGIIATDSKYSYYYARDIIKGRFEKGEQIIVTDPENSYFYARYVIKDPFHLCHHIIFNSEWRDEYIKFLKSINCDFNEISEWLI